MNLQFADNTNLVLVGAREATEYINNQRRAAICLAFDATKHQDAKLREVFTDREKTQTMQIDNGTPIEGYIVFVRSVYESGQISIVMAQDIPAAEAQLRAKVAEQADAIVTVFGTAPDNLAQEATAIRAGIEAMSTFAPDAIVLQYPTLLLAWISDGREYTIGDRVQYDGLLYRCLTAHASQASWSPDAAPSLWVRIDDPAIELPEWRQPAGSTDAYAKGAKVSRNGKHWTSDVDANVWEPPTQWTEVVE